MYIQITEKCNMTCEHCCFAATTKGAVMDRATYMQALMVAIHYGEYITIGGGEPTTHPQFFDYLDKAIELFDCGSLEMPPHLVTNGKLKGKAMKLLDYVDDERSLHVELSRDYYHDPIDPAVVRRFEAHDRRHRQFRNHSDSLASVRTNIRIMPVGRAVETGVYTEGKPGKECCCETPLVDPKGDVWSCGCKTHKLGSIWDNSVLDGYSNDFAHQGGYEPNEDDNEGYPTFPIFEIRA